MKRPFDRASFILIAWVIFLSVAFTTLSLVRHQRFESGGFDLGLYDQAVWQYSRFIWPYNTIKDRFILGDHLTLTLPLLAPLYWLWNDVRILLIFQAVWISASTLAVYKLTLLRKFSAFTALVVSFLYSLFYGIQYAVFFDFHPVTIGVGLVVWLLYFLESGQKTLFYTALGLLLLTQENMGLLLASVGIIYLLRKDYQRTGLTFILLGLTVSLIAAKIIGLFSPTGFQYWPQFPRSLPQLVIQFFDSIEKRQVWFYSLSWFAFLPLASPGAMLAIFLDLAQYFVTGPEFSRMWSPFMHHRATLAPLVTLGTLEALARLKRKKINMTAVSILLLVVALTEQYVLHLPLNKLAKHEFWQWGSWMDDNRKLIISLPQEVPVATQQNLVPHLSHRKYIYLAWPRQHDFDPSPCGRKSCWWLDFDKNAKYLLVDLRPHQWLTQILETNENFGEAVRNMEEARVITLERAINDIKLYRVQR